MKRGDYTVGKGVVISAAPLSFRRACPAVHLHCTPSGPGARRPTGVLREGETACGFVQVQVSHDSQHLRFWAGVPSKSRAGCRRRPGTNGERGRRERQRLPAPCAHLPSLALRASAHLPRAQVPGSVRAVQGGTREKSSPPWSRFLAGARNGNPLLQPPCPAAFGE